MKIKLISEIIKYIPKKQIKKGEFIKNLFVIVKINCHCEDLKNPKQSKLGIVLFLTTRGFNPLR